MWLTGKCHELTHRDWDEKDMSSICNLIYKAMQAGKLDGGKMIDEDYIMIIFSPLYLRVSELEEYLNWYFKNKASYPTGIHQIEE